jgi:hypothetical protein
VTFVLDYVIDSSEIKILNDVIIGEQAICELLGHEMRIRQFI